MHADCRFHHLGAERPVIATEASLSMRQVTFESNYAAAKAPADPPALIAAASGDVRLEACSFEGNANHYVASVPTADLAKFYAHPQVNVQLVTAGEVGENMKSLSLTQVPAPTDGSWSLFLSDTNDWFKQLRKVWLLGLSSSH